MTDVGSNRYYEKHSVELTSKRLSDQQRLVDSMQVSAVGGTCASKGDKQAIPEVSAIPPS